MQTNVADLHRSRLEALLAIEVEFQRKTLALSNRRIQEIKRLIAGIDELHIDVDGDEAIAALTGLNVPAKNPSVSSVSTPKKKKKKHKKASPPTKPIKISTGKPPRIIDAIQIVMRNKEMKAQQVYDLLKAKGWLPKSNDPLGYIRFTLSSEGEIFQRKEGERGVYHLDPSNPCYTGKFPPPKGLPKRAPANDESSETKSSVTASPKAITAPEEPQTSGSEPPPPIGVAESHSIVEDMMHDRIPLD